MAANVLQRILTHLKAPDYLYQYLVDMGPAPNSATDLALEERLLNVESVLLSGDAAKESDDDPDVEVDWLERVVNIWMLYLKLSGSSEENGTNSCPQHVGGSLIDFDTPPESVASADPPPMSTDHASNVSKKTPNDAVSLIDFDSPPASPAPSSKVNAASSVAASGTAVTAKSRTTYKPTLSKVTNASRISRATSYLKSVTPSSYPSYIQPQRNQTIALEEDNMPAQNRHGRGISRSSLRSKIQEAFFDLQVESAEDVSGLATMIRLIYRTAKLIEPYEGDARIRSDLYDNAMAKMPKDLLAMYRDKFGYKAGTVSNLFAWLCMHTEEMYEYQRQDAEVDLDNFDSVSQCGDEDLSDILCLQCFSMGHTKKFCLDEPLVISKRI